MAKPWDDTMKRLIKSASTAFCIVGTKRSDFQGCPINRIEKLDTRGRFSLRRNTK